MTEFKVGDRVRTISNIWSGEATVTALRQLDGDPVADILWDNGNPDSFYFRMLTLVERSHMTKILSVRFPNSSGGYKYASAKEYNYFYTGSIEAEVGDIAVVDSPYSGHTVVEITGVRNKTNLDENLKAVIGVISQSEQRRAADLEKRRKALKEKIKKVVAKQQDRQILQTLANQGDSEAAALLRELEALG